MKRKIISEKVNAQFVEIKKEKKKEEQSLDNELEQNDSDFVDFSTGNRTAPVLSPSNTESQTIEQQLANVPGNRNADNNNIKYEAAKVYNMPDYGSRQEHEQKVEVSRPVAPVLAETRTLNLQQQQRDFQQQWERNEQAEQRNYHERIHPVAEEERRMPFSRREERRKKVL